MTRHATQVRIAGAALNGPAPLARVRLPVSGREVQLRQPTGADDLVLLEARASDTELALVLVERLVRASDGAPLDGGALSVCDLEVLVLRLREALVGERIWADVVCRGEECGQRIDLSFRITEYLAHRIARAGVARVRGWRVSSADDPGWFCVVPAAEAPPSKPPPAQFRLITARDQLIAARQANGAQILAERCIRPAGLPPRQTRAVEAAMETMAPSLSGELAGICPKCSARVSAYFDVRHFCLRELRERAAFVYEDIDVLARQYHWSEREIVALSQTRRVSYAALARQHGSA